MSGLKEHRRFCLYCAYKPGVYRAATHVINPKKDGAPIFACAACAEKRPLLGQETVEEYFLRLRAKEAARRLGG